MQVRGCGQLRSHAGTVASDPADQRGVAAEQICQCSPELLRRNPVGGVLLKCRRDRAGDDAGLDGAVLERLTCLAQEGQLVAAPAIEPVEAEALLGLGKRRVRAGK